MKIFLSYGHDQNAPIVERIANDLRSAGHTVWIDAAEIKSGDDWRRAIVDGLLDSDWTLGFLSRHSVRDPGVCLDELAIALHVKGGVIATVLLESEATVLPPVSLSHIQWLDLQDWKARQAEGGQAYEDWYRGKFGQLAAMLADPATKRFAGEIEQLERRLRPVSHQADIGMLVDGFVGREWLKARLDLWRKSEAASRLFWLSGPPGIGKSAFAAWLAHRGRVNVIGLNLCRYNSVDRRNPRTVICTLAFQIATRLPDYRRLLLHRLELHDSDREALAQKSPLDLFNYVLADPLTFGINGGRGSDRFLVVIDALDETIQDGHSELAELLVECASKLPQWIAFVVTGRREPSLVRQFAAMQSQVLEAGSDDNLNDLRAFAHDWLEKQGHPADQIPALTEHIVAASDGNFLYLRKLRDAVDSGLLDVRSPENLPQGLVGLYERWFRRQFTTDSIYESYVPLLEVLSASEHPVPEDWLTSIFHWSTRERARMLEGLGSLFERRADGVAPFHKSVRDWLTDEHGAGAAFVIDVAAGTERLVQALWTRLIEQPEEAAHDPFFVAELPLQIARLSSAAARAPLLAARSWDEVWNSLTSVANSLDMTFAWDAASGWWRMAAFLAETRGDGARFHRGYALRASGDVLATLGHSSEALNTYRQAMVVNQTLASSDLSNFEWRRSVYVAQIRVGNVLMTMGDLAGALKSYRAGLETMRAIFTSDPDNAEWQRDRHICLERIGKALVLNGELAEALATYRQDIDITTTLADRHPDNMGWQHDKAVTLASMGDVLIDQGDFAGSLQAYQEALTIFRGLTATDPAEMRWRRDLYAILTRVGDVLHRRNDVAGALARYAEGRDIMRILADMDKRNVQWRGDWSTSLVKMGDAIRDLGEKTQDHLAEALTNYRAGLDIIRALSLHDPSDTNWRHRIFAITARIGDALHGQGDLAGALAAYRESLDVLRRLLLADPHNPQWRADAALSLWRLATVGDRSAERLGEALQILEQLKSEGRLAPAQLEWIDAIAADLAELRH